MSSIARFIPSMRLTVVTVFTLATTLTAAVAIGLQFYFGQLLAKDAARDLYTLASGAVASEIRHIAEKNTNVIELLAENPALGVDGIQKDDNKLKIFAGVLEQNPLYYGIYLGHRDGSLFEVINLDASELARKSLRALPTDLWLLIRVAEKDGVRERHFSYYNKNFELRINRSEPTEYDVRTRGWYTTARETDGVVDSNPYLFAQLGQAGQTFSKRLGETDTVVGIDITMSAISQYLGSQSVARYGDVFLYNSDGKIVASSNAEEGPDATAQLPLPAFTLTESEKALVESMPVLSVSNELNWPPFDYAVSGKPKGYSVDVIHFIEKMTGLQFRFVNGFSWKELTDQFQAGEIDLLHSVVLTDDNAGWGLTSDSYAHLPFAIAMQKGSPPLQSVAQLAGKSVAIPEGWSVIGVIREKFPDVNIVESDSSLDALRRVLAGEVDAALDNEVILRHVAAHYFLSGLEYHSNIDFGSVNPPDTLRIMVSADAPELMALINRVIKSIGVSQRDYLVHQWLDFESDSSAAQSDQVPSQKLVDLTRDTQLQNRLLDTEYDGEKYFVYGAPLTADAAEKLFFGVRVPEVAIVGPFMEKVTLSLLITAAFLLLLLPLLWFFTNPIVRPIKQLAIENDKVRDRQYDNVLPVKSNIRELDELSESMLDMVSSIKAYELAQRELMDSFIQLIAQAIDDKSPYTGGHCERVPELALMLAAEASESTDAPFDTFQLSTEEEWREYRIAAWLHDCGKITTPEHIVDKGSKLETIYNRIHEVRMRFEVLHRDAEIDYWRILSESPQLRDSLQAELAAKQKVLQEDFAFVAVCNVGGEFLDPEKQERLREIGSKVWMRYFDDRIGLSPVDELRLEGEQNPLPAREALLSDKPDHIVKRTRSTDYPPEYRIDMDIPEHLFNQGEIYNLSISRGTLTAEDRFKINEHMISTIKMLESLPFPDELKNVPRYASTHHETMRGTGYPRKLPGDQLSIPERLLAIADIFEALTASDRPYKKAKPVSVAVDILHKMMLDNHVDKDCFELFVHHRVYETYAQAYLDPGQIDEVDASKYLGDPVA